MSDILEQAQAAIESDKRERLEKFKAILEKAIEEYKIAIVPTVETVLLSGDVYGQRAIIHYVAR